MLKRVIALVMSVSMLVCLCGCSLFAADTAELLSPPSLSGDLYPIAQAIEQSATGGYNFEYPSRGNYRSAVVQEDINSDGILEAFAFYSITEGETVTMHINYIKNNKGEWGSVAQQRIVAGGVDRLEFCDLDGDGIREILVGWEIYGTSEMQLAVYSIGEYTLTQRMLQKYTHFITCDLDEDDVNEILVLKTNMADSSNSAALFKLSDEGVTEIGSCELDSAAKTVNEPIIASLSTGKPAIYIDEIKGVGAITEVLFVENGTLVNPLLSADTKENLSTLRSVSFGIKDINDDGIMEIPVQENVPSVAASEINEKLYLTSWCSFNGEVLVKQLTTMINVDDSYYYTIPAKWSGHIAVLKDVDSHLREIYRYDFATETLGESLMYIKAVPKSDWDEGKYNAAGIGEIMNDGQTSYICRITEAAKAEGLTMEMVKSNFKLFE